MAFDPDAYLAEDIAERPPQAADVQEGFDPDLMKQGIGNVLRTYVIQYCVDNKIKEYDFTIDDALILKKLKNS